MKQGVRAAGIAESYVGERSTLAGAVVRADRMVEDIAFGTCEVGGTDATDAIIEVLEAVLREDVSYVLVAGIAPAWFNVLDLAAIQDTVDRPVLSVSFETSEGLEPALRREFEGQTLEARLATYRRQPHRHRILVNDEDAFVRAVGIERDDARDVVRTFTPEGGRPEPLRVARIAARAADRWRTDS